MSQLEIRVNNSSVEIQRKVGLEEETRMGKKRKSRSREVPARTGVGLRVTHPQLVDGRSEIKLPFSVKIDGVSINVVIRGKY